MKFLPNLCQLFVMPRWERGRLIRGHRLLERPPAANGGRDARAPGQLMACLVLSCPCRKVPQSCS